MNRPVRKIIVLRLLSNMAKAISTQNIFITAFGLETPANTIEFTNNLKIVPFDFSCTRTMFARVRSLLALSKSIKDENPDIIHVNALQDLLFAFVAVNLGAPHRNKPAIIAMSHNPQTWRNPVKAWLAAKWIRFFADGFVALATTHKDQLLRLGIPENRLAVIPNPNDIEQVKQNNLTISPLPLASGKFLRVVCMATIMERKAQDVLIQAAALILKNHTDVYFDLVGNVLAGQEAYVEKMKGTINELNIGTQVHFVGGIPHQEVAACLAASDIFAFPTRSEMMPRAVIEAMSAGKPVVASAVDGIYDLIRHRETGILVQPGNVKELAEAICELIENPSLARELGLAGQEYILDFCSPVRVGKLFHKFYQGILDLQTQN